MKILISNNSYFSSIMCIVIYTHYIKKVNMFFILFAIMLNKNGIK